MAVICSFFYFVNRKEGERDSKNICYRQKVFRECFLLFKVFASSVLLLCVFMKSLFVILILHPFSDPTSTELPASSYFSFSSMIKCFSVAFICWTNKVLCIFNLSFKFKFKLASIWLFKKTLLILPSFAYLCRQ